MYLFKPEYLDKEVEFYGEKQRIKRYHMTVSGGKSLFIFWHIQMAILGFIGFITRRREFPWFWKVVRKITWH